MEKILKNRGNFLKIIFFREINVKRFCAKTLSARGKLNLEGWGGGDDRNTQYLSLSYSGHANFR